MREEGRYPSRVGVHILNNPLWPRGRADGPCSQGPERLLGQRQWVEWLCGWGGLRPSHLASGGEEAAAHGGPAKNSGYILESSLETGQRGGSQELPLGGITSSGVSAASEMACGFDKAWCEFMARNSPAGIQTKGLGQLGKHWVSASAQSHLLMQGRVSACVRVVVSGRSPGA